MSARFRILRRPIDFAQKNVSIIVCCICVLHNLLMTSNRNLYAQQGMLDAERGGVIENGRWREEGLPSNNLLPLVPSIHKKSTTSAKEIRESLMSSEVLMAVGLCAAVCFGLTLFAFQTKWDFTVMGGVLFVAVIILFLFGIIAAILPGNRTLTLVYASLGALVFCVYLVYDTQMMMGGKHKYSISPEEYIFAALSLYLDVINIFLYLLTIIGIARD